MTHYGYVVRRDRGLLNEARLLEALGESGKLVLNLAHREAEDLSSASIGTEHLLLAVIDLEDAAIQNLFRDVGLDLKDVSAKLRQRGDGTKSSSLSFSPAAERALELARAEAEELGQALVEAPQILIGVLREKKGAASRLLDELAVDRRQLAKRMRAMLTGGEWTPSFYVQRRAIDQPTRASSASLLESLGRDLTESAVRGELSPIVERDRQIADLILVLCGMRKPNALLVGQPGVGKTAIVEGLAQWIAQKKVPEELVGVRIRTIEVASLVAGTALRGQLEQRLQKLIAELSGHRDVILFLDEAHMLIGAGVGGRGATDAAALLRPLLNEGELRVIGATTPEAFSKYLERDVSFTHRFQTMLIEEPPRDQAVLILNNLRPKYEHFHRVRILDESLATAVDLAVRYIKDRCLPDKALDVLDRTCTRKRLAGRMGKWIPDLAPSSSDLVVRSEDVVGSVAVMLGIPASAVIAGEEPDHQTTSDR
jgi:ATP-dependent Clp protease ATP-binding subunit ClpC